MAHKKETVTGHIMKLDEAKNLIATLQPLLSETHFAAVPDGEKGWLVRASLVDKYHKSLPLDPDYLKQALEIVIRRRFKSTSDKDLPCISTSCANDEDARRCLTQLEDLRLKTHDITLQFVENNRQNPGDTTTTRGRH